MKERRKKMKNLINKIAIWVATTDANTACPCITYQPKLPESVKKLRKL